MRHIQTFFEKIFCGASFIISDELGGDMKAPVILVYLATTFALSINLLCIDFLVSIYLPLVNDFLKKIDYFNEISVVILFPIQYLFTLNKYSYAELLARYEDKTRQTERFFQIYLVVTFAAMLLTFWVMDINGKVTDS